MAMRADQATPAAKLPLLRRLNLFEEMTDDEVEAISRQLAMSRCVRGQGIYAGNHGRVYLLKSGSVRLYRLSPNGDEVTTAIVVPGELFGTMSLFGASEDGDHADAVEDSYICEASAADFLGIMARHPLLMAKVMMAMARQLFRLERTVEQLVNGSVEDRLAGVLAAQIAGAQERDDGVVLPEHTRDELAAMVMATRETVSRTLARWRREGIVELRGRRIVVLDQARLRRRAKGRL
jgi:CRP/FNR family cyclic AMP-dependent transcriptional regulator